MVIFHSFLYVYQRVSWGALKNMYSRFFALQLGRLAPQIRWFLWAQGPWPGADCLRVELRAQHSAATWSSDWNLKTWNGLEWHDPPCIAGTKHVSEINSDKWYIIILSPFFYLGKKGERCPTFEAMKCSVVQEMEAKIVSGVHHWEELHGRFGWAYWF
jgi:hypothetical protein